MTIRTSISQCRKGLLICTFRKSFCLNLSKAILQDVHLLYSQAAWFSHIFSGRLRMVLQLIHRTFSDIPEVSREMGHSLILLCFSAHSGQLSSLSVTMEKTNTSISSGYCYRIITFPPFTLPFSFVILR